MSVWSSVFLYPSVEYILILDLRFVPVVLSISVLYFLSLYLRVYFMHNPCAALFITIG